MGSTRKTAVQLQTGRAERDNIAAAAEARNLSDASFCRLIVAGALRKGGANLDRLLEEGERVVGKVRNRGGPNLEALWTKDYDKDKDEAPTWRYMDTSWRLTKLNYVHGRVRGARDDKTRWWHLVNTADSSFEPMPIAFERMEARLEATEWIRRWERNQT